MKIGLGLYRRMLDRQHYDFAAQAGCTHVVAHLTDYTEGTESPHPLEDPLWTREGMAALAKDVRAAGLELAAIENFDPRLWHDVLIDGPRRREQMEVLKRIVADAGSAGIPVIGYNFSIAGVVGRTRGPFARGGAISVGMDGTDDTPMAAGEVWGMIYDPEAKGTLPPATHEQLWDRVTRFLAELLPVAEESGVRLAAHPDDPPMPVLRGQPRLVYQHWMYQRLMDLHAGEANAIELCVGSLAEMTKGDLYETVERFASQGRVAYVHLRNVVGTVPYYREVFIDEGDVDIPRVIDILENAGFDGVVVPDHTPTMSCDAGWHAGMAYALGYIRGVLQGRE